MPKCIAVTSSLAARKWGSREILLDTVVVPVIKGSTEARRCQCREFGVVLGLLDRLKCVRSGLRLSLSGGFAN